MVVPGVNTCWPDLVLSALFLSLLPVALSSLRRPVVPRGGVAVEVRLGDWLAGCERGGAARIDGVLGLLEGR